MVLSNTKKGGGSFNRNNGFSFNRNGGVSLQRKSGVYFNEISNFNEEMRNGNSDFGNFYDEEGNENLGRIEALDRLIAMLADTTIQQDSISYVTLLNAIGNANSDIVDNGHDYENCEQWITERYLAVLKDGECALTIGEKINIALLANSCPAAVGNCVYRARSLYALLYPGMQYNDDLLCAAALPQSKNGSNPYQDETNFLNNGTSGTEKFGLGTSQLEIYPNPNCAGCQLNIKYRLEGKERGEIVIYDMVGQAVQRIIVSSDVNRVLFSLDNALASGTYKIVLQQGNKILTTKKLSIVE